MIRNENNYNNNSNTRDNNNKKNKKKVKIGFSQIRNMMRVCHSLIFISIGIPFYTMMN